MYCICGENILNFIYNLFFIFFRKMFYFYSRTFFFLMVLPQGREPLVWLRLTYICFFHELFENSTYFLLLFLLQPSRISLCPCHSYVFLLSAARFFIQELDSFSENSSRSLLFYAICQKLPSHCIVYVICFLYCILLIDG